MPKAGSRIRKLRIKNNLKQKDLAKIIGISKTAISNYERDYRNPDMDTIQDMADYFKVSVDYLLGRTDYKKTFGNIPREIQHLLTNENNLDYFEAIILAMDHNIEPDLIIELLQTLIKCKDRG